MCRVKFATFVLLSLVAATTKPEPPLLPTKLRECETRCSNALRDYLLIVRDAKEQYIVAIEKAMKVAMRDQDLDRAVKLKAEKEKVEKEIKELSTLKGPPAVAGKSGVVAVKAARWGSDTKWADVTSIVQGHISGTSLILKWEFASEYGDPAPGEDKHLTVVLSVNGQDISCACTPDRNRPLRIELVK
jgi:hypothetical protein